MAMYQAQSMVDLVQFCAYKAGVAMNPAGWDALAVLIFKNETHDFRFMAEIEIYMRSLVADSREAVRINGVDALVTKRSAKILTVLKFAGFESWDAWQAARRKSYDLISSLATVQA